MSAGSGSIFSPSIAATKCPSLVRGFATRLDEVHLGDLLVERATGERDAEHGLLEAAVLLVQPGAAAVLLLVVAPDAVIRLVLRSGEVGAGIGQPEAVARPPMLFRQA